MLTVPAPTTAVGPVGERWPDVNRIVVVRGGGLGDVLSAMPALDALAAGYPDAEVVLLCPPNYADLLSGRPSPASRVVPLPPATGVWEEDDPRGNDVARQEFYDHMRGLPVDLGVQVHGGGRWSNPFLLSLRPRWTVGTRTDDAAALTRSIPYRLYQSEAMRWLEVVGLAGATPVSLEPRIAVTAADLEAARRAVTWVSEPFVAIHPGARDPRRRWPAENFAHVAVECVNAGSRVAILGSPGERRMLHGIAGQARDALSAASTRSVVVLDNLTSPELCGVLAHTNVLVGNDSGVRHLARALGTPTVGIFWIGNVINTGPLGRARDRVLTAWTTRCPVCDRDCTRVEVPRCEHDVSFVADVRPDEVLDELSDFLP